VSAIVNERFDAGDFTGSLTAVARLRDDVDTFFDKVLVNTDDPSLRAARLGLLNDLGLTMNKVADISKLAAEI
jgi:glycyl-tRNA synthetase beta chain